MKRNLQDRVWLLFYKVALAVHLLRIDYGMETMGYDHEENLIVNIVAETKWCWQKRSSENPYSM